MEGSVTAPDINAVLKLVTQLSADGDVQLTILLWAFVAACRSSGADTTLVLANLAGALETPMGLVPLEQALAANMSQKLN